MIDIIYSLLKIGFIKYGLVGATGFFINMSLLWLLTDKAHVWYLISAIIAIIVSAFTNYVMNYHWTFKNRKSAINNIFIGYLKYLLSRGFTEGVYLLLLFVAVNLIGFNYMVSAALIQIITSFLGYVVVTKFIWKKHHTEDKPVFDINRYY